MKLCMNKDCGAIGCVKSHINVLELCLKQMMIII